MKKNFSLNLIFAFFVMIVFLNANPTSANQNRSVEVDKFITMLESSLQNQRINAAKLITRSGLSEPRLFSVIDKKLLNEYDLYAQNPEHIDEMSWMCKALASSGTSEYNTTLKKISQTASSKKLRRYATQSLNMVNEYTERNRILQDTSNSDPNLSPQINKYIRMLKSNKLRLKKDAAKSLYRGKYTEPALFDVVKDELLKGYKNMPAGDRNAADTMAWLCKALGASGNLKYKQTLVQVIKGTTNKTLKRYAQKSLNMLK